MIIKNVKNGEDMFNDLYYKVDLFAYENGFAEANTENKKEIIDEGLKNYIIEKLKKYGSNSFSDKELYDLSTTALFIILSKLIPKEEHFDTIRYFSSYLVFQSMSMQNKNIEWNKTIDKEYTCEFQDSFLNSINCCDEDYQNTFLYIYDIFMNRFMCNNKTIEKKF